MKRKPILGETLLDRVREALPGIVVEDHPYDIGFWACYAQFPIPADPESREGWNDALKEIQNKP